MDDTLFDTFMQSISSYTKEIIDFTCLEYPITDFYDRFEEFQHGGVDILLLLNFYEMDPCVKEAFEKIRITKEDILDYFHIAGSYYLKERKFQDLTCFFKESFLSMISFYSPEYFLDLSTIAFVSAILSHSSNFVDLLREHERTVLDFKTVAIDLEINNESLKKTVSNSTMHNQKFLPMKMNYDNLLKYGIFLEECEYFFDPAIGRQEEIKELAAALATPSLSILLVGEAGVGKTSIVKGFAYQIQKKTAPNILKIKKY